VRVVGAAELDAADRASLERRFDKDIYPLLTPIAIEATQPLPFMAGIALGLDLVAERDPGRYIDALLPLPCRVGRFLRLADAKAPGGAHAVVRFVRLETVLDLFIDKLFPGYALRAGGACRVLRAQEAAPADSCRSLVHDERSHAQQQRGEIVRLELDKGLPRRLRDLVVRGLDVAEQQVHAQESMLALADLSQLIVADRPDLLFAPHEPRAAGWASEHGGDLLAAIRAQDRIVHHPYESIGMGLMLVRQAAADPLVLSVKWTLDAAGSGSPMVEVLAAAAEAGKQVTVIMPARAGVDARAHGPTASRLASAGALVVQQGGEPQLHTTLGQIVRSEADGLRSYVQLATDDLPAHAAGVCSGLSLFSALPSLGRDASRILNYVTSRAEPCGLELLAISPYGMRDRLLDHVREEIYHVRAGRPAQIWLKMRALDDEQIIDALYEASQAGVMIDVVVRDVCRLRPGIEGLSENIRVKSLLGRFEAHERLYCFGAGHGLPSEAATIYIASADLTRCHLDGRIALLAPVDDRGVRLLLQNRIMQVDNADNEQSWHILPDGSCRRCRGGDGPSFDAQHYLAAGPRADDDDGSRAVHHALSLADESR
jgi:polyphosphate kinase